MSFQDETNAGLFAGPSEMHARISAHHWTTTSTGPVEAWPQNIKTTIKVLLGSRYPMMLLFSPDLIQLYNDAYAELIGGKHPHALGRSIRETQAESWDALGPLIQEVMASGVPRWVPTQRLLLERAGYREEVYLNLSCRAVEDDAGATGGVLCACNEVTEQVTGERRRRLLCDLGVKGGGMHSVEQTCRGLAAALAEQPLDVPFTLIYLRASGGETLALRGAAGLEDGGEAGPLRVDLQAEGHEGWPFAQVAAGETALIEDVERHVSLVGGPFDEPIRSALMMPLASSEGAAPVGVLVAGVSPNRALDEGYRSFYELLAEQVSAAVRNAQAYEEERRRLQGEIAERKRAGESLKKTNAALARRAAELDAIFQSLPGAVYVGSETGITRANREALKQLGYADLEELNHNIAELAEQIQTRHLRSGERLSTEEEPFARALRGEPFARDVVVRHRKTGEDKVLRSNAAPIRLDGEVIGAVAINTDITERVRTAEALRESEERKRAMLESSLDCIITIDHHGRILEFNPAAERTFGYAHDSVIGRPLDEIIVPHRLRENHRRGMARFLETDDSHILGRRLEMPAVRADGSEFPAELTITCTRQDGAPPFFTGFLRDITERKQAEMKLKEAQERTAFLAEASAVLAASSLDFEKTLQQVADLAVSYLADWCVVTMAGEEGGVEHAAPKQVTIAHADPHKAAWARALTRRYPPNSEAAFGIAHVIRTGRSELHEEVTDETLAAIAQDAEHLELLRQIGFASAMVVPLQVRGETLGALMLVSTDPGRLYGEADLRLAEELTRRAAMEVRNARLYREAKQDRARAEEMNRLKSAFLANMSHEIRTPLTGIIGFASILAQRLPGKEQDFAQRIGRGGQRLMDTLEAVLSLSQLEARGAELQLEALPVAREVRQIASLLEHQVREKNLSFSFTAQPGTEEARARLDRGALNSILHNLIGNAIKFTDQGAIDVTVETDAEHAYVRVEDTGPGIDEAFVPRLFDAFQQESSGWNRSHEGTGLGLSIAKRLAEQMRGTITAQSEKGQGSCFTVQLPLAQEGAEETEAQEASAKTLPRKAAPPRILVVEDNIDTRLLMQTLLEQLGDVAAVSGAEEALAAAKRSLEAGAGGTPSPFDLLLIDINLGPGKSGEDVLDVVRTLPGYQTVPMAAVTAYALPGDREQLLTRGFDAFLRKPFNAEELIGLASELLQP